MDIKEFWYVLLAEAPNSSIATIELPIFTPRDDVAAEVLRRWPNALGYRATGEPWKRFETACMCVNPSSGLPWGLGKCPIHSKADV